MQDSVMKIADEIKWNRLLLALVVTVLIADTVPHPGLAPGLLQSLAHQFESLPATAASD